MPDFIEALRDRARRLPKRIVFPESGDPRVLRAAVRIVETGMARPVLIGVPAVVEKLARDLGVRLAHIEIVNPTASTLIDRYAKLLLPDWKSRGVTELEAQKRFENPMYFAAAMVRAGEADGFVGGAATTTAGTVRAAIHCIGLHPGSSIVSSFFLMVMSEMNLLYADCAVVPFPTVPQLAGIAIDAAENARIFLAQEPRVAFLSFSTKAAPNMHLSRGSERPSPQSTRESRSLPWTASFRLTPLLFRP